MRGARRGPGSGWRSFSASPRSTRVRRAPRTRLTEERSSACSCPLRPEGELELEAGIRLVQLVAEQLAQAGQSVANRLRMQVQGPGRRRRVAAMLDEGQSGLLHPCAPGGGEPRERSEPGLGEAVREPSRLEDQQVGEMLIGWDRRAPLDDSRLRGAKRRPGERPG